MNTSADVKLSADYSTKLVTPKVYATDELHEIYTWLRNNNPLGIAEPEQFDPFWVVTKHQDVMDISKNNTLFPYGSRPSTLMTKAGAAMMLQIQKTGSPLAYSLIQMDPPVHMKYRALTQSWFSPSNLKKREEEIRGIAQHSVDHMLSLNGKADFVADVALNYPLEVIMNILGVPKKDFGFMLKLTQEIFAPLDPDTTKFLETLTADQISQLQQATAAELVSYFDGITQDRLKNPREDLATVIVNSKVDGEAIPPNAINGYYLIVATAGHDTTSSTTSTAMWALATQPGLLERLQADPSLIPALIDESIRWATPVKNFMRSVSKDVEIRGRKVKAGDWLMLCYASANRDEEVFDKPFDFNIDRTNNKHVGFGYGPHVCLGQHLAKMEIKILLDALIPRLKSVRLAGEPQMAESFFVNGLKKLPIEFEIKA
jgi:cytochrome P450